LYYLHGEGSFVFERVRAMSDRSTRAERRSDCHHLGNLLTGDTGFARFV
jgi:hypothetical protein